MSSKQKDSLETSEDSMIDNSYSLLNETILKLQNENNDLVHENEKLIAQRDKIQSSNNSLIEENRVLTTKKQDLENNCISLREELSITRQKNVDDSNRTIGIIIECLQGSEIMNLTQDNAQHVSKYYSGYLINILSELGVDLIEDCGVHFNPQLHRVEAIVYTDNIELSGIISKSLGSGFRRGDICLIEQPVEVYKYKK